MSDRPVALVGLDRAEAEELTARVSRPVAAYPMLPKVQLRAGELYLARVGTWDWAGPVGKVVFHGIFEDDLPAITALALWGGPCLPSGRGLLDTRPRIANLARVRRVSRFAALPRGFAAGTVFPADGPTVAKWGEWHCGEGKERVAGDHPTTEPTLFEPFLEGEAVRVTAVGDALFQLRLGGDDWKKSIHHPSAGPMPLDPALADDVRRMRDHFDLAVCAADYVVTADGTPQLLELNHVPNVTEFADVRAAYLDYAAAWVEG
jgi:hypothetical protein